jgi:hypothetical protein
MPSSRRDIFRGGVLSGGGAGSRTRPSVADARGVGVRPCEPGWCQLLGAYAVWSKPVVGVQYILFHFFFRGPALNPCAGFTDSPARDADATHAAGQRGAPLMVTKQWRKKERGRGWGLGDIRDGKKTCIAARPSARRARLPPAACAPSCACRRHPRRAKPAELQPRPLATSPHRAKKRRETPARAAALRRERHASTPHTGSGCLVNLDSLQRRLLRR